VRERFLYEYRYDLRAALWRHEIRIEKTLSLQEQWPYPRCIADSGTPPPESVASPQEFRHIQDLFTPRYILHHLAGFRCEIACPEVGRVNVAHHGFESI
jgi:hypothetical protein